MAGSNPLGGRARLRHHVERIGRRCGRLAAALTKACLCVCALQPTAQAHFRPTQGLEVLDEWKPGLAQRTASTKTLGFDELRELGIDLLGAGSQQRRGDHRTRTLYSALRSVCDELVLEEPYGKDCASWLAYETGEFMLRTGMPSIERRDFIDGALTFAPKDATFRGYLLSSAIHGERGLESWGRALERSNELTTWLADNAARLDPLVEGTAIHAQFLLHAWLGLSDMAGADMQRWSELGARVEELEKSAPVDGASWIARTWFFDRITMMRLNDDYVGLEEFFDQFRRAPKAEFDATDRLRVEALSVVVAAEAARKGRGDAATAGLRIRELLQNASLPTENRAELQLTSAYAALDARDFDAARLDIESLRSRAESDEADPTAKRRQLANLAALAARLAVEAGPNSDGARLADVLSELEQVFRESLAAWQSMPPMPAGIAPFHFAERQALLSELIRLEVLVHGEALGSERSVEELARLGDLGTLARALDAAPATIRDVREHLLPESGALLVLYPARDRSHLIVLDRETARHFELPPSHVLQRARDELERRVSRSREQADRFEAARDELSRVLIPARLASDLVRWKRVTLVGFDQLGYVPFDLLRVEGGREIGLDLAIAYLPSLSVGLALTRRPTREGATQRDLALVAALNPDPRDAREWNLVPIPIEHSELEEIAESYPPGRASVAIDVDSALDSALIPAPAMLHVMGHGVFDPRRVRPAGLVLNRPRATSGIVWPEDVERIRAPRLVYLSACGTGAGPVRRGDDSCAHIGGTFLQAGARAVLLSFVDIETRGSLELAREFHRGLIAGLDVSEALRMARRSLPREHVTTGCLVHVIGLGHEPLFAPRAGVATASSVGESRWVWIIVGLSALILGSVWVLRRRRVDPLRS